MVERGRTASSFLAQRYSSDAEVYDDVWSPVIRPVGEELVAAMPLHDARCVLDAGVGAGALVPSIRRAAPHATVIGLDVAFGMLSVAVRRHDLACMNGDGLASIHHRHVLATANHGWELGMADPAARARGARGPSGSRSPSVRGADTQRAPIPRRGDRGGCDESRA
jgi:hypothetical protein